MQERPDTIVVNVEPCPQCQDFLASVPSLRKVAYGLSRQDLADKGLMRPHGEDAMTRAERVELPYQLQQIDDDQLRQDNLLIFDHVSRDIETGQVQVDYYGMMAALKH